MKSNNYWYNILALFIFLCFNLAYCQTIWKIKSDGSEKFNSFQEAINALPVSVTDSSQYVLKLCENISPTETIVIKKSGNSTNPIIITTNTGEEKILGGNLVGGEYSPAIKITGSNIVLKDITFDNFNGENTRIMFQINGGQNNRIVNCVFSNFIKAKAEAAISIANSANNNIIEQCKFYNLNRGPNDQYLHAVYINDNSNNNLIQNCYVEYCSGDAFKIKNNSDENIFDGNIVEKCGGPAYYAVERQDTTCTGNIIRNAECRGPSIINGYYTFYIKKFRSGNNNYGDNGKIWIDEGSNRFITTGFGF